MTDEIDDYDVFLETWEPGERLNYALLPQNQADPLAQQRVVEDSTGAAPLERTPFSRGDKLMSAIELRERMFEYFEENHDRWAEEFRDYLLSREIRSEKIDAYNVSFAEHWVDGRKRRQDSPEMLAIKASIKAHDAAAYRTLANPYVLEELDPTTEAPLFTPEEMASIFDANRGLIDALLPDYIDALASPYLESLGDLYVRRGVYMPQVDYARRELHYLSSYSLSLGPVEQFAQTYTSQTRGRGIPTVFSAPLDAIKFRVVAFAPFVEGMDLRQLELVVAPPTARTPLKYHGVFGDIHEVSFE